MFGLLVSCILAFTVPESAFADISGDLNCTQYNGTFVSWCYQFNVLCWKSLEILIIIYQFQFVWTPAAVACSNAVSDASCTALYPTEDEQGYPAAGNNAGRPLACFTTAAETPAPVDGDMKKAALTNCAKTCGFCCNTDDYSCPNAQCKINFEIL